MSKSLPTCYAVYYRKMSERARELGYAMTLHGSLLRDADMVAIPWTSLAADPETLADAMLEVVGGYLEPTPTLKPHGRIVRTYQLGAGHYIDLGIMPRKDEQMSANDSRLDPIGPGACNPNVEKKP